MNWRGILGLYAGLAVVIGGGWLWTQSGATWTFGVIAAGFALALASVVHIVRVRKGPRPAKVAKLSKIAESRTIDVAEDDADAVARGRLAALARRNSGAMSVMAEPVEVVPDGGALAEVDLAETDATFEPTATDVLDEVSLAEPIQDDHFADETLEPVDATASDAADDPDIGRDDEGVPEISDEWAEPVEPVASAIESEPSAALVAEREVVTGPLDALPGFPWSARFIGLWTRDAMAEAPEEFREAIAHWQRWADAQPSGAPVVAEAGEEFRAMIDIWRGFGDPPGLMPGDEPAVLIAEEAEYDAALAAVLPVALLGRLNA